MKKKNDLSTVAILMFCFIAYAQNATGSVVESITAAFEVTPAMGRMVTTLPGITTVLTAFLFGFLAGKVPYRLIYILTCIFWGVGGMMPVFFHSNYTQILLGRLIFGLGTGFGMSTGMYFVSAYPPERQAGMVGLGTAISNIGSLLFLILGGALGELNWMYPFYLYVTSFVTLIMVTLFLREPSVQTSSVDTALATRTPFSLTQVLFPLTAFIIGVILGVMNAGMSTIVTQRGLGGSLITSIVLAMATIGGILTGMLLDHIHRSFRQYAVSIMLTVIAASCALTLAANSVVLLCTAAFLNGIGYYAIKPLFTLYIRASMTGRAASVSTMLLFTATNLGTFLSNSWISLSNRIAPVFGSELENAFLTGTFLLLLTAAVFLVYHPIRPVEPRNSEM